MDGFKVTGANRFLQTGGLDSKSMKINDSASQLGMPGALAPSDGKSFADTLKDAVTNVNDLQKASDKGMQDLATGKTDNIADTMITAEKADIAVKLMVQVRNKIIDAYQEVMKMQV